MADITLKKLQLLPITDWLRQWALGDQSAINAAYHALEPYLIRAASSVLHNHPATQPLTPKALIHEAWLRLNPEHAKTFKSRQQFFGTIVKAMHFYLIDEYRANIAKSRAPSVAMSATLAGSNQDASSNMEIDNRLDGYLLLAELEKKYPRQARHLLFTELLGLTLQETAELSGKPIITIRRDLEFCEAWFERLRRHAN